MVEWPAKHVAPRWWTAGALAVALSGCLAERAGAADLMATAKASNVADAGDGLGDAPASDVADSATADAGAGANDTDTDTAPPDTSGADADETASQTSDVPQDTYVDAAPDADETQTLADVGTPPDTTTTPDTNATPDTNDAATASDTEASDSAQSDAGAQDSGSPVDAGKPGCKAAGDCANVFTAAELGQCRQATCFAAKCSKADLTGPACDDDNACTEGDACAVGVCFPGQKTKSCDDTNLCTADSCDKAAGCMHSPIANACDDNNPCTVADACAGGACKGGAAKNCDDGNKCTVDACAQTCTAKPGNDGAACPTGTCSAGVCQVPAGWPLGADGDLIVAAGKTVELDADNQGNFAWDFKSCTIAGTLKIVGTRSWVMIGCKGDLVLGGSVHMLSSYEVAAYKDGHQPDAKGKPAGYALRRVPYAPLGGAGGAACKGSVGGAQSGGNGGGGAAGGVVCGLTNMCGAHGVTASSISGGTGGSGVSGGAGTIGCSYYKLAGGQGATATTAAKGGVAASKCNSTCAKQTGLKGGIGSGGGGGFHARQTTNLLLYVGGKLALNGSIHLSGSAGTAGGPGGGSAGSQMFGQGNDCAAGPTCPGIAGAAGGGGAGGAAGKLVLRGPGMMTYDPTSKVVMVGGGGGGGGATKGPDGVMDRAHAAPAGDFGGPCVGGACTGGLTCTPITAAGMCSKSACTVAADCPVVDGSKGVCAAWGGSKTCFVPCGAGLGCDRPGLVCDAAKGCCVPP